MGRTTTVTLVAAVLLALAAGTALAATITCQPGAMTCQGTNDDDTMDGTPGQDQIDGGLGNDGLFGNDGEDTVSGGPGNDTVEGAPGNDTLNGNDGNDDVSGVSGNDTLNGDAGNDTLNGDAGNDKIDALESQGDTSGGEDTVSGGPGNDTIGANDGVKGDDIDCGPGSRDIAYSDKGDSVSRNCEWQPPYHTAQYCPKSGPPWIDPEATGDSVPGHVGGKIIWCIDGTPRDDKKLHGTTGYSDLLDSIWGDKGDDKIDGGLGPDSIEGWSGNDIVKGGAGGDFLYGDSSANPWPSSGFFKGAGEDKISGGPGDDFISAIDNKKDTISCGGGKDYVQVDKRGVADNPTPGRSTVTDKVANDCEDIFHKAEHSSFFCRIFGHRKRH